MREGCEPFPSRYIIIYVLVVSDGDVASCCYNLRLFIEARQLTDVGPSEVKLWVDPLDGDVRAKSGLFQVSSHCPVYNKGAFQFVCLESIQVNLIIHTF